MEGLGGAAVIENVAADEPALPADVIEAAAKLDAGKAIQWIRGDAECLTSDEGGDLLLLGCLLRYRVGLVQRIAGEEVVWLL